MGELYARELYLNKETQYSLDLTPYLLIHPSPKPPLTYFMSLYIYLWSCEIGWDH